MPAEILIYGAVTSAIYAMLALGFTLVFGVARTLNLAHGSFYALGAYFAYLFSTELKLPLVVAAALSVAITALFGAACEVVVIRPQRKSQLAVLVVTLALGLVVEQVLMVTFGSEVRNVPAFVEAKVTIGGADVAGQRLLTLVVCVSILCVLWAVVSRTKAGAAVLAVSQDTLAARYMGIPVDRLYVGVVALSAGLAASAGILAGPFLSVQPGMGVLAMVKAFAIVIVGGLGSAPGSILAAVVLGYSETIVAYLLSSAWTEVVSLAAVLATLIIRPAGLRGKRAAF
jgi:branched-chain amino acid transport system permease protein